MSLEVNLLGPATVRLDGRLISRFRASRVLALLAYLAAAGPDVKHRREALQALLWPEMLARSAQTNLRQTLYQLRKIFAGSGDGQSFLLTAPGVVWLNPDFSLTTDLAHFERLRLGSFDEKKVAVALYRGPFLADFYLPDANPFEQWAGEQREHYRQQMLLLTAGVAAALIEREEWAAAADYVQRQLALDPLTEVAQRQLMTIYWRTGRRTEALQQYQRCRELLEAELAVAPSAETEALRAVIVADEPQSAAPPPLSQPEAAAAAPRPVRHNLPQPTTPFVGRAAELAQLERGQRLELIPATQTALAQLQAIDWANQA